MKAPALVLGPLAERPPGAAGAPPTVAAVFCLLIVLVVAVPYVELVGPLSTDDLLGLSAVGLGLLWALSSRARLGVDPAMLGLVAFAVVGALSSVGNAETLAELGRLLGRSSGRAGFYLVLITLTWSVVAHADRARQALLTFSAVASAEATFAVWACVVDYRGPLGLGAQSFSRKSHLFGTPRAQGTFGGLVTDVEVHGANFLAAYLVMGVLVTAAAAIAARSRRAIALLVFAAILQAVALYLTYTRAALLALAGGMLMLGWCLGRRRTALATIIVGVVLSVCIPSVRSKFLDSHNRFALYVAAARIAADHPVLGVGDGRYGRVLKSDPRYFDTPYGTARASAHNSILQSAAYHGLLGGVVNLLLYALVWLVIRRRLASLTGTGRVLVAGIAAALFGLLVQDQFNNLLYAPKIATQACFLFGLTGALQPQLKKP